MKSTWDEPAKSRLPSTCEDAAWHGASAAADGDQVEEDRLGEISGCSIKSPWVSENWARKNHLESRY